MRSVLRDKCFGLLGVGNELLSGKVEDLNLSFWIKELRARGLQVSLAGMAPDNHALLTDTIRFYRAHSELLLLSGGIGPTHDDVTLVALASALGRPIVRDAYLEGKIRAFYGDRTNDLLLTMADVPEGTQLLFCDELLVPLYEVDGVFVFPGDPGLMRKKFRLLARSFRTEALHIKKLFTTFDEGEIAAKIERLEEQHEGLSIGSYPRYDDADYRVLLVLESRDAEQLGAALAELQDPNFRAHLVREEDEILGLDENSRSICAGDAPGKEMLKASNEGQ